MATVEKEVSAEETSKVDDSIALEIGHIIWYLEIGSKIEDVEEMQASWTEKFPEMKGLASQIIEHMFTRGISVSYFDRGMSHFGKE